MSLKFSRIQNFVIGSNDKQFGSACGEVALNDAFCNHHISNAKRHSYFGSACGVVARNETPRSIKGINKVKNDEILPQNRKKLEKKTGKNSKNQKKFEEKRKKSEKIKKNQKKFFISNFLLHWILWKRINFFLLNMKNKFAFRKIIRIFANY
jgi:hypothetical protein